MKFGNKSAKTAETDAKGEQPAAQEQSKKGGFKFAKAFGGFNGATPDGNLPKLNDRKRPDGRYLVTLRSTNAFESFESDGVSFKAEVDVVECDNGQFRPGTRASIIVHGIDAPKEFTRAKAQGNVKALLAAAMTSKFAESEEDIVDPYDDSLPWESEYIPRYCAEDGCTDLDGARFSLQCTAAESKAGQGFKKLSFEAESPEEGKAA